LEHDVLFVARGAPFPPRKAGEDKTEEHKNPCLTPKESLGQQVRRFSAKPAHPVINKHFKHASSSFLCNSKNKNVIYCPLPITNLLKYSFHA
jgi:hypothetical protein